MYASDPPGMDRALRRESLDALRDLNEMQNRELGNPETLTRIAQYELAFRMQMSVPEVMDITKETKETLDAYGAQPGAASFANNCLLAAGSSSREFAMCNFSTGAGIFTAPGPIPVFSPASPISAPRWTVRSPRCCAI